MINIDDKTRRLSQATIVVGYKQENKAESIEFEIPDYLKEYGKKICFKTKDGKVFSKLFDNTTSNIFTFTRTETQHGELDATIQFFKAEDEDIIVYKTSMLHIIFKDAVICEDEIQPDDPKYPILEDLIIKVSNITKDITKINKNIEDIDKKNTEQDTNIANKVDKEAGKGLSSNDYTDAEKEKLASLSNYNDTEIKADITDIKSTDTEQDKKIAELEKENIKLRNQIPNGQASGNNIHIEDSSDLELKWKLKGGHKQETRSGRNLYDIKNVGDRPIHPEISIDDDDWITVTADNSSGTSVKYVNYFTENLNLKPNTQYSLIAEFKKCTGDDSVSLSLVNNGNNEGQFNSNHSLEISSIKENNTKKSKLIITTKADLSNTKNGLRTYLYMPAGTSVSITFRLSVIENTSIELDNFEYEKYGISPSPEYPSEIETVSGSVKIDVVNKNLFDIIDIVETTKGGITYSVKDGVLKLNGTATAGFDIELDKNIKIKKGKYTHSSSYVQLGIFISLDNLSNTMITKAEIKKTFEVTKDTIYKKYFIWIDKGTVLNNVEIKLQLEAGNTATDFVEHQSQTITMPIQQEMLEGDYIDDVEHHEWKKLILTGSESNIKKIPTDTYNRFQLSLTSYGVRNYIYCTHYLAGNSVNSGELDISCDGKYIVIHSPSDEITTGEQFKTWLKQQYDAGTPVIVYYKLATPFDLKLTTEQKAIREQKLHTYKNITNISLSDELASIDVTYKKDLETMFNNIIKQIPSSTSDTAET